MREKTVKTAAAFWLTRERDEAIDVVDVALTWEFGQGGRQSCKETITKTVQYGMESRNMALIF